MFREVGYGLAGSIRPTAEVIVLGEDIVYQVRYDGIVTGAKLLTAPEIAAACRAEVAELWQQGQDLRSFLARAGVLADSHEPSYALLSVLALADVAVSLLLQARESRNLPSTSPSTHCAALEESTSADVASAIAASRRHNRARLARNHVITL